MDEFATLLAQQIVTTTEVAGDDREVYAYVRGMRHALQMYLGVDEARRVLFAMGHEY